MEYKFKEGQEDKPAIERIIEKRGHVVEFSLLEMEHDLIAFEKTLKELKGNRDLKQGVINNMDIHHPFIKDMSDFDRYTVHLYQENWAMRKAYNEKIVEIEKQFEEYKKEIATIKEMLPELADIPSPYVEQPAAPVEKVEAERVAEPAEQTIRYCSYDRCENRIDINGVSSFCEEHSKTDGEKAE